MFTLNGGVAKKNKENKEIPADHTQIKVLTQNPFENLFYPLKILGIFVFFAGLSYLLFSKADAVRSYLDNIITQAKVDLGFNPSNTQNGENTEKAENTEKGEKGEKGENTENTEVSPDAALAGVNKKLAVLEDYVETTKAAPAKKPPVADTPQNSSNVKGFCLVGEERGRRECIEVENSDECMSGDIFTTENQCVNPNMRYDA
jgi:hypothetical protein